MAEPRSIEQDYYCADCLITVPNGPWNFSVTLYEGATLCARHVRERGARAGLRTQTYPSREPGGADA